MKLTMVGRLDECLLLAYRTPAESVRGLVPPGFALLTRGAFAFWGVVACRVRRMRPAGAPAALGLTYHHVAYRLYVRCRTAGGEPLDGIYFVRSDADSTPVCRGGNWLTDFRFHRSDIALKATGTSAALDVDCRNDPAGDAMLRAEWPADGTVDQPRDPASPFASAAEAGAFLKYRPLGLSPGRGGPIMRLAEVFRDESLWDERPIQVTAARWGFFDSIGQGAVRLEHAARVAPIDYRWRLGNWRSAAKDAG